jgi:hypothetical protein
VPRFFGMSTGSTHVHANVSFTKGTCEWYFLAVITEKDVKLYHQSAGGAVVGNISCHIFKSLIYSGRSV